MLWQAPCMLIGITLLPLERGNFLDSGSIDFDIRFLDLGTRAKMRKE